MHHLRSRIRVSLSRSEWRDPGGGYRFDLLKANFPKWLPCYFERDFADERGCHTPLWAAALFPDGAASVSRSAFAERISALEFSSASAGLEQPQPRCRCGDRPSLTMSALCPAPSRAVPMGPKGTIKPDATDVSPEAIETLWTYLCDGAEAEELEAAAALKRLQDMSPDEDRDGAIGEGPDFVDWKAFAKALGAAPFERW